MRGAGSLVGGRYRLEAVIGRGGTGEVYRAADLRLDRLVALKVYRSAGLPEAGDRIRQEALLVARLGHPNLVAVLDAGTDEPDGTSWLALELVGGPDVAALLAREGALPSETVRHLVAGVAAGLAHIHARGIVHRDLKPANVILTADTTERDWAAKLTDFGIARMLDDAALTSSGTVIGTAAYLSPERLRGDSAGTASDVYSLGLLALEALTGERAFPGTSMETAAARLVRDPTFPTWLQGTWRTLLQTMTAADPRARPSAATVARALARPLPEVAPARAPAPIRHAETPTAAVTLPLALVRSTARGRPERATAVRAIDRRAGPRTLRRRRLVAVIALVAVLAGGGAAVADLARATASHAAATRAPAAVPTPSPSQTPRTNGTKSGAGLGARGSARAPSRADMSRAARHAARGVRAIGRRLLRGLHFRTSRH